MAKKEQLADMEQDLLQNIADVFTGTVCTPYNIFVRHHTGS